MTDWPGMKEAQAALEREYHVPPDAMEIVKERVIVAARIIEQATTNPHPNGAKGFWPPIVRDFADLAAQGESTDKKKIKFTASARQIMQAEETLEWRIKYITEAYALAALNIRLRSYVQRKANWQEQARMRGLATSTAKKKVIRAYYLIARGLAKDGKPFDYPSD